MQEHITYCRNCCAQCGVIVTEEDGKLTRIRGDKDNPFSQGYFCVKGQSSIDQHNGEDRLTECHKRDPEGSFHPIAKSDALDEIGEKLDTIIAEHGSDSVAVYSGTGVTTNSLSHSAKKAWMEAIDTPYLYTSMTLDQPAKWVTCARMGIFLTGKYGTLDGDVVMLTGSNPAVSHASMSGPMVNPMKAVRDAKKRGMKLIVVDPCKTTTARMADIHVQIRPGEDAAFFAGLIRIVLRNGWHDAQFCERFTTSLAALTDAVEPFIPEYVQQRTGVSPADLHLVAETFATAKKKSAHTGTGPNMSLNSNVTEHLAEAFNAICGGYRRAGDTLRNIGALFNSGITQETVFPPNRSWEEGIKCHSTDVGQINGEYPTALLPKEILNSSGKRIRALIVVGGNLAKALSDPNVTLPALRELDLLVTLDPRPTDIGRLSHYQIATSLPYERLDLNAILEYTRHMSFGQIAKPFRQRPEGVMDDWEFFTGLAARAGKTLQIKQTAFAVSQANTPGPAYEVAPGENVSAEDLIGWMASLGHFSYEELASNPHGVVPAKNQATISSAANDMDAKLDLCPNDVVAEVADLLENPEEDDPDFPFRMVTRRLLESLNSAFTNSSKARRRYPDNPVFMNSADMAKLGLKQGDSVTLRSKHGSSSGLIKSDDGLLEGVVAVCHAWGQVVRDHDKIDTATDLHSGALVSIEHDLSTYNYMPRQSAVPVSIEPL